MKVIYLRLNNGLFPNTVTVPPTSIDAVKKYLLGLASNGKPMNSVITQLEVYKKDQNQDFKNIRLKTVSDLEGDALKDAKFLREYWKPQMKGNQNEQKSIEEEKEVRSTEEAIDF